MCRQKVNEKAIKINCLVNQQTNEGKKQKNVVDTIFCSLFFFLLLHKPLHIVFVQPLFSIIFIYFSLKIFKCFVFFFLQYLLLSPFFDKFLFFFFFVLMLLWVGGELRQSPRIKTDQLFVSFQLFISVNCLKKKDNTGFKINEKRPSRRRRKEKYTHTYRNTQLNFRLIFFLLLLFSDKIV